MLDLSAISLLLPVIGALVIVVNLLTEVLKKVLWDKIPTNILVVLLSEALTLGAFFAYVQIKEVAIVWYLVVGAVVVGLFVAYAAMFGFDKLKEVIQQIASAKIKGGGSE